MDTRRIIYACSTPRLYKFPARWYYILYIVDSARPTIRDIETRTNTAIIEPQRQINDMIFTVVQLGYNISIPMSIPHFSINGSARVTFWIVREDFALRQSLKYLVFPSSI